MNNLPTSRSITVNTGDPIPPALPNELQDMFPNGGRRSAWKRSFYPHFIYNNAGGFIGSANGQPCLISSAATIVFFEIPYDIGDRLTALSLDVFGGGGSTLSMHVDYATAPGVAATVLSTVASFTPAAAWNAVVFPALTPQIVADGSYLHFDVTTSAAGLYIGRAVATFDRLP